MKNPLPKPLQKVVNKRVDVFAGSISQPEEDYQHFFVLEDVKIYSDSLPENERNMSTPNLFIELSSSDLRYIEEEGPLEDLVFNGKIKKYVGHTTNADAYRLTDVSIERLDPIKYI